MKESSKIVGIQGGRGSFNELAALNNLANHGLTNYQLRYLHTTENVFKALESHEIDFGQFAIRNSLGGEVEESVEAMTGRTFTVMGTYQIKIAHALMISPKAKIADIETIITHPQVIRQCEQNLKKLYEGIKLSICKGDLIDPAKVAELMSTEKLPKSIATVSNKLLAQIHNLKVVAEDLQDSDDNYTTFLLVKPSET
jgi:prephenate dehydratase